MEGLGPGSGRLLLARAAWREGKLKFNNNTNLMPSVLQEMKECVHIQDTAHNIYMMNSSGGNSSSHMQFLYQVKCYVQMSQQWEQ